ncbi:MAG: hypothetical protein IKA65_03440 [Lentisphaeria bacterium]|nr:hypothetical protein [Lentisphaeria bacterium]
MAFETGALQQHENIPLNSRFVKDYAIFSGEIPNFPENIEDMQKPLKNHGGSHQFSGWL